jgi:hypothetical protein
MSKGQIVFAGDTAALLAAQEVRKNYGSVATLQAPHVFGGLV